MTLKKLENPTSTKNSNTHCTWLHRSKPFVNVAKRARDQCSIFSMVQYFDRTTLRFLLELHALTLAAILMRFCDIHRYFAVH